MNAFQRASPRFLMLLCLLMLAWFALQYRPGFGLTRAMAFGDQWWSERLEAVDETAVFVRSDSFGYDGQFYAQIALDPTMSDPAIESAVDIPSYRARRILMPAVAYAVGLGNPAWILHSFPFLNLIAWLAMLLLLRPHLPAATVQDKARWVAIAFSMGTLESIKFSLTDLPALVLLLAAWHLSERMQSTQGKLDKYGGFTLIALAGLTKETSLLAGISLPKRLLHWIEHPFRYTLLLGMAALPFVVWAGYLAARFDAHSGFAQNFDWPFAQLIHQFSALLSPSLHSEWAERELLGAVAAIGLLTQLGCLLWSPAPDNRIWRTGVAFGLLMLVLGPAVWHGYWAVMRSVLPLTIAFNLLYRPKRHFWPFFILANASILHGLLRV